MEVVAAACARCVDQRRKEHEAASLVQLGEHLLQIVVRRKEECVEAAQNARHVDEQVLSTLLRTVYDDQSVLTAGERTDPSNNGFRGLLDTLACERRILTARRQIDDATCTDQMRSKVVVEGAVGVPLEPGANGGGERARTIALRLARRAQNGSAWRLLSPRRLLAETVRTSVASVVGGTIAALAVETAVEHGALIVLAVWLTVRQQNEADHQHVFNYDSRLPVELYKYVV